MALDPQKEYDKVVSIMESTGEAKASKMFGMPCLKNEKGKAFAGYFHGEMNFKLPAEIVQSWLKNKGAKQFDPGMGRPMKEWLQLPVEYHEKWKDLAKDALDFVNSIKS
jgi:hypothetical protein